MKRLLFGLRYWCDSLIVFLFIGGMALAQNSSTFPSGGGGLSNFSSDGTSLSGSAQTVTTSKPILDLTQTWNAGGVTFTGLKSNVTSTASASLSLLQDWQVAGSSVAGVVQDGSIYAINGFW